MPSQKPDARPGTSEPSSSLPDYVTSPDAVFKDLGVEWRFGEVPDYSETRKVWKESRQMRHAKGSLGEIVENLVKNWEIEASFKSNLRDWRTIDHENYSFAMGSEPAMTAEHMIKVGTYNGIITRNQYYSPEHSDFASSHKTFKHMVPTFAWEVMEVYSGPPKVAFRWGHWGTMENDYVGFNDKGQKITSKAHGGQINIGGVTVASVDNKLRLQSIVTWMDPLEMFRQISPKGIVTKEEIERKVELSATLGIGSEHDGETTAPRYREPRSTHSGDPTDGEQATPTITTQAPIDEDGARFKEHPTVRHHGETDNKLSDQAPASSAQSKLAETFNESISGPVNSSTVIDNTKHPAFFLASGESTTTATLDAVADDRGESSAPSEPHPKPNDNYESVSPEAGQAVAIAADSQETRVTNEEMSRILPSECPFLMNRE